jgi:putative serine protease PepD
MRVVIVPATPFGGHVRDCLMAWSRARLLVPFGWWEAPLEESAEPEPFITLVHEDETEERVHLARAAEEHGAGRYAVVACCPVGPGEAVPPGFVEAVRRRRPIVRNVGVNFLDERSGITMIVLPSAIGQSLTARVIASEWEANLYVAPENRTSPRLPNHLLGRPDLAAPHVAHSIATVCDLWRRADVHAPLVLDVARERQTSAHPPPVQVVRCFTRVADYGFLADHVSAGVFRSDDEWPNPDIERFDRLEDPDPVVRALVKAFMIKHKATLGLSEFVPIEYPEVEVVSLLEALRRLVRLLVQRVAAKPFEWFDTKMENVHDTLARRLHRLAGSPTSWRIAGWNERPDEEKGVVSLEAELEKPAHLPDGPVGEAWSEFLVMHFGLLDGTDLPSRVQDHAMVSSTRRLLITEPAGICPDPRVPPPNVEFGADRDGQQRPCDPLGIKPVPEHDALEAWLAERRVTPAWLVGEAIARDLREARMSEPEAEEEVPAKATPAPPEDPPEVAAVKRARRRRRWLRLKALAYTAIAGAAGYAAVQELPPLPRYPVLALIGFLWLMALANAARKLLVREQQEQRDELERRIDELNRAALRAQRRGDARRLARRYEEFLDWAEVVGHVVHRPWVAEPFSQLSLPDEIPPETLPPSLTVAFGAPDQGSVQQLSAQARTQLFTRGWLTDLYRAMDRQIGRDTAIAYGAMDPAQAELERPDATADVARDKDSPRRRLRAAVRRGDYRSLRDTTLTRQLLDFINRIPIDAAGQLTPLMAESEDDGRRAEPLPPSLAWFEAPADLTGLAAQLRPSIVRVHARETAAGGSGVIISGEGLVATNRHVVEGAESLEVTLPGGRVAPARLVAAAGHTDLALLDIGGGPDVVPVQLAGAEQELRQGEPVLTLGHPKLLDGEPTLGWGLVTAARRMIRLDEPPSGIDLFEVIQATYRSAGGASGSPVFDMRGRVVGIHCARAAHLAGDASAEYMSSAVPVRDLHALRATAALPAAGAMPAAGAREGRPAGEAEAMPGSQFLRELTHAHGTVGFLRDHWRDPRDEYRVADVVPAEVDLPPLDGSLLRLSGGARYLEPLRVIVHRVEFAETCLESDLVSGNGANG